MARVHRNTIKLDPFNGVYGLPPKSHVSDDMIINSMPQMEIIPGKPYLSRGLTLFRVDDDWPAYRNLLANHGFTTPEPIKLAFIADNFPTDTFTNDYGETFLQKFTDVASQGLAEIIQMTGSTTASEAFGKFGVFGEETEKELGGIAGSIAGGVGKGAHAMEKALKALANPGAGTKGLRGVMGGGANMINKMLGGHRIDFPMIWRNSGFTPSYTATIRLYNPNPSSESMTNKYIIGPLAVILCLATPQSDDGKTYSWPFFQKIKAKGIYNLDPAVITNITVIKGGDQQQIAFNQRLGLVDVRIDFGSLYGTMLVESSGMQATHRPTVRTYLDSLKQTDTSLYKTRNQMRSQARMVSGAPRQGEVDSITAVSETRQLLLSKNNAVRRRLPPTVTEVVQSTRVPAATVATEANLIADTPPDFLPENEDLEVDV